MQERSVRIRRAIAADRSAQATIPELEAAMKTFTFEGGPSPKTERETFHPST